jgi:drug/metabolite transporter (DMT)-like permease
VDVLYLTGIALSAFGAFLFALQNVLVRIATVEGDVGDAVVVVMATNALLIVPPAVVLYYPTYGLSWLSAGMFATAGLVGLMLGRICVYGGIQTIGASRTTPVVSASTVVSAVAAIWVLDESVTVGHGVGIGLIVAGIAIISWVTAADSGPDISVRETGKSLLLPLGAAFFIGIEPVFVRIGLDAGTPIPVGLAVMMSAALIGYIGYRRLRGSVISTPARSVRMRWYVAAGVTSAVGLLAYFAALETVPVVIAIPIIQTAPLLVIVLSIAFLPRQLERVTWRLVAAAVIVVVGATLVSLAG